MGVVTDATLKKGSWSLVVIGASLGGLCAIETLLGALSPQFSIPIIVVLHRSPHHDSLLCDMLQRHTSLRVSEPEDKDPIVSGVFLAPPGYHLLVERGRFALSLDEPVFFSRPSIDVLFDSAATAYGAGTLGIVLTGANDDGLNGVAKIRLVGGTVVAQDPSTAEAPQMPSAAIRAGANMVLPLHEIARFLAQQSG